MQNILNEVEAAIRDESRSERLTSECSALSTFQWKRFKVRALAWSRGISESYPSKCYFPHHWGSVELLTDHILYEVSLPSLPTLKRKAPSPSDGEEEPLSPVYKSEHDAINKV